ncbi:MAG: MBL fold metallo-hydrolase [Thermoleophilaceae bacterium]|nr:MBL fold metallo-hydrolase [Thermoleophilaceae bacterium]
MKVAYLTVGPVGENTFLVINDEAENAALLIDPGDEPDNIAKAIEETGADVKAILLTHTHFDHVGAVKPMADQLGVEVWVPELERHILADINNFIRFPGVGPFESYEAEHTVKGGEHLELAGFDIDVFFTPGHSIGHVSYSIRDQLALFSGDVLFQGSIGRTDLPGGDAQTLLDSIAMLMDKLPIQTAVFPGHMGVTTLEAEAASNPYLAGAVQG